jgi:hypothetical protein
VDRDVDVREIDVGGGHGRFPSMVVVPSGGAGFALMTRRAAKSYTLLPRRADNPRPLSDPCRNPTTPPPPRSTAKPHPAAFPPDKPARPPFFHTMENPRETCFHCVEKCPKPVSIVWQIFRNTFPLCGKTPETCFHCVETFSPLSRPSSCRELQ